MDSFKINEDGGHKNLSTLDHILSIHKINHQLFILVPAYNEEKTVGNVLQQLVKLDYPVIIVDDGSQDKTNSIIWKIKDKFPDKIFICQHLINQGLGSALKTGITCALNLGAQFMVTFDADGQHNPSDIAPLVEHLKKGEADVVLGRRDFEEMPLSKKIANQIMNTLTRIFYRMYVNDSQCGLRGFNKKAMGILEIKSRGYGVSSEIIREIKRNNLKMVEVPITTIYTDYSRAKGTDTSTGMEILFKMIMELIKKF